MSKFKIALTGGIGTGKTWVSQIYRSMQIPVYNADEEAKKLYQKDEVIKRVVALLGESVINKQQLIFSEIARIIFNDKLMLKKLNQIIHPLLIKDFECWAQKQSSRIVMMEAAIIFEASLEDSFDLIIVVDASMKTRLTRIKMRNNDLTEEEILQRIANQIDQEEKCRQADLLILNEKDEFKGITLKIVG